MEIKGEQPFLHATHCFDHIYMPTKYYQNISKGMKVIEHTNFCIWTDAWLIAISPKPCRSGDKNINIFNEIIILLPQLCPRGGMLEVKKSLAWGFAMAPHQLYIQV